MGVNLFVYVSNNPLNDIDSLGLISLLEIENYLKNRAMQQFKEGNDVAAFIDILGVSASCFMRCILEHYGMKVLEEILSPSAGKYGAMTYYHYTDKRFKAWGKNSLKMVPKLGGKIAARISIIGWAMLAYYAYDCVLNVNHVRKTVLKINSHYPTNLVVFLNRA